VDAGLLLGRSADSVPETESQALPSKGTLLVQVTKLCLVDQHSLALQRDRGKSSKEQQQADWVGCWTAVRTFLLTGQVGMKAVGHLLPLRNTGLSLRDIYKEETYREEVQQQVTAGRVGRARCCC
jgi:hypothetical protein